MINMKNCEAQEIFNYFSCEANSLVFKPNKIAEEQKDSLLMKDLDLCWIKVLSNIGYRTDLRNKASARVGKQLADIPFVKNKLDGVNNPKMEEVSEKMACEHRTIQQSFSKLIFYHFILTCNEIESKILFDIMGEDFYRLPLI